MRRSYMKRRRSRQRSWEDRAGRAAYLKADSRCERCGSQACDPEHVLGRGWHGADDPRALLRVCRPCHRVLDQSRDGRIESLWCKKQADSEFSLEWFDERVGYSLSGKLSNWLETDISEWHKSLIRELLGSNMITPTTRMRCEFMYLKPGDLEDFGLQQEIYGTEELPQDFIDSIKAGIVVPIVAAEVGDRYVTLAGHRRKRGAVICELNTVPCIVYTGLSELDMQKMFLRSNEQREKTNEQKIREGEAWERIFAVEAETARHANLNQNSESARYTPGRVSGKHARKGESADRAGEMVGISGDTLKRGKPVIAAIDQAAAAGDTEKAETLRTTLNTDGVKTAARKVAETKSEGAASDLRDSVGIPVPECFRSYFEVGSKCGSFVQRIGKLASEFEQLFEGTSGLGGLRVDKFVDHLNRAQAILKLERPHTLCPTCDPESPKKNCARCGGHGWITKSGYEGLSAEMKTKLEEMK